jgi:excisionase family DNA binding protein
MSQVRSCEHYPVPAKEPTRRGKMNARPNAEGLVWNEALPRFLRVEEVANLLRCKKRTIYDMVEQDRIPYRRVGGRLLFDADEIIEWTKVRN